MKLRTKNKILLKGLELGSLIASLGPLLVVLALNWGRYTETPAATLKLCFGGLAVVVCMVLKVLGKLKMPGRLAGFAIAFAMVYLLEALLQDLQLILGMALMGEVLDSLLFQPFIKRLRDKLAVEKTADATASKVEDLLDKYINGRV